MLIDTSGFVYHIPTFKSKIDKERDTEIDPIKTKIMSSIKDFRDEYMNADNDIMYDEEEYDSCGICSDDDTFPVKGGYID